MRPSRAAFILLITCTSLFISNAQATESLDPDYEEEDCTDIFPGMDSTLEEPDKDKPTFSFMDGPHQTITGGLKNFTRAVDAFFANEDVHYDSSSSYLRLTSDSTWSEGGNVTTRGDLKIRIHLPRTEKKLKLVFESDPDEKRNEIERVREQPIAGSETKEKEYYAGLETELGRKDQWRFKPSLRVKLRTPLEYLLRFRGNRAYQITDNWRLDLAETLYWFNTTGFGADTNIDFNYQFNSKTQFRSNTFFRYTDLTDYWDLSQVFAIDHKLSDRRAISYQAAVFGISEPAVHATNYLLAIRYRQNIHSDYVFGEVIPQILYPKDHDFHSEHSILFRIELVFND